MSETGNNHDFVNQGTCGKSISRFKVGDYDIYFFDNEEKLLAKIPKIPEGSQSVYGHNMYKDAKSRELPIFNVPILPPINKYILQAMNFSLPTVNFPISPISIDNLLPHRFEVKHGYINCIIKHDSLSNQEKKQVKKDIISAYEIFKKTFCFKDSAFNEDITVHIFNNRNDYIKYSSLVGILGIVAPITLGATRHSNVIIYKQSGMDFVLAHELGHIFQYRFGPQKVKELMGTDTEFIAHFVGREVEKENHKAILKEEENHKAIYEAMLEKLQKIDIHEYKEIFYGGFTFKYKGLMYSIKHKNLAEEEKYLLIKDIKNSHESLIREYKKVYEKSTDNSAIIIINIDENKEIEGISCKTFDNLQTLSIALEKELLIIVEYKNIDSSSSVEESSQISIPEAFINMFIINPRNYFIDILVTTPLAVGELVFGGFISWLFGYDEPSHNDVSLLKSDQSAEPSYIDNYPSYDHQSPLDGLI